MRPSCSNAAEPLCSAAEVSYGDYTYSTNNRNVSTLTVLTVVVESEDAALAQLGLKHSVGVAPAHLGEQQRARCAVLSALSGSIGGGVPAPMKHTPLGMSV
jgi:hypothetical protein